VEVTGSQLVADVEFDQADEFARTLESKYRRGFLNAVSVGWQDVIEGKRTWHDLMDISGVPVPADPQALKAEQERALRQVLRELEPEDARAISDSDKSALVGELKDLPMRDLVATHRRLHMWAAQGNLLTGFSKADMNWLHAATEAELRRRAKEDGRDPPEPTPLEWGGGEAGVDATAEEERWLPGTIGKIADKFKKKKKSGESDDSRTSDAPVWRGISSAMLDVFLCHDTMEDEVRHSLYNVLERAYRRLDKEPPEFRSGAEMILLGPEEIRGLFLEGEVYPMSTDMRTGAVLNARNRGDLERAVELVMGVLERATKETPEETPRSGEKDGQQADLDGDALLTELHRIFLGGQHA
jgi:hypothetical protein